MGAMSWPRTLAVLVAGPLALLSAWVVAGAVAAQPAPELGAPVRVAPASTGSSTPRGTTLPRSPAPPPTTVDPDRSAGAEPVGTGSHGPPPAGDTCEDDDHGDEVDDRDGPEDRDDCSDDDRTDPADRNGDRADRNGDRADDDTDSPEVDAPEPPDGPNDVDDGPDDDTDDPSDGVPRAAPSGPTRTVGALRPVAAVR